MAYSNWGGGVWKNNQLLTAEKCDVAVYDDAVESDVPHSLRIWYFLLHEAAKKSEETQWYNRPHHAVLGDGKIRVGLYKTSFELYEADDDGNVVTVDVTKLLDPKHIWEYDPKDGTEPRRYVDNETLYQGTTFTYKGHKFSLEYDDCPCKISVEMKTPEGDIWTGFSGYCMGAGYE